MSAVEAARAFAACALLLLPACASPAKRIAAAYDAPCPSGATAHFVESSTSFEKQCKAGEVLEGPTLRVHHQALSLATTTEIHLQTYHRGRLSGQMMDRRIQTSRYPQSNFDHVDYWYLRSDGRRIGTEAHHAFVDGQWKEATRVVRGDDGRLLSLGGMFAGWRSLEFPSGTGPFTIEMDGGEELRGACADGLRDGAWTYARGGKIVSRHAWKRGVADGEFLMNDGMVHGIMRAGVRVGRWEEGSGGGECLMEEGDHIRRCVMRVAPVRFVAIYDDRGNLVRHEEVTWLTSAASGDRPATVAGTRLPSFHMGLDPLAARCDELAHATSAIGFGMR